MKDKEIKDRITELVASRGGNRSKLAQEMGIQPGHIGMIMTTDTGISASLYKAFASIGVNMNWLFNGTGEMKNTPGSEEISWEDKYNEVNINFEDAKERLNFLGQYVDRLEIILKGRT